MAVNVLCNQVDLAGLLKQLYYLVESVCRDLVVAFRILFLTAIEYLIDQIHSCQLLVLRLNSELL